MEVEEDREVDGSISEEVKRDPLRARIIGEIAAATRGKNSRNRKKIHTTALLTEIEE